MSLFSEPPRGYLFSNKYLAMLIVPLAAEVALSMTVGVADTIMVSTAGEAAISGVSLVDNVNNLIMNIMMALATGGAVVTSQFLGAGKKEEASKSADQLFYAVCALGLFVMGLCIAFRRQILGLLFGRVEEEVMRNCLKYFFIISLSFPFMGIYNASAALFRSMGNSRVTFIVSVVMNIINVTGNAVCVLYLKMGVAGVAIPSLISRIVAAVIVCILLLKKDRPIHYTLIHPHFDKDKIVRILRIGIPSGIENGIFQLGRVLVISVTALFGTVQIAANGVGSSVCQFVLVTGQAACLAMITIVGQCVGAGDEEQVRYYTKKVLLITYIVSAIVDCLILIFLDQILSVYRVSPEAAGIAKTLLLIYIPSSMLLWPLGFVLPNALRACNDVKYTMVVSIFSMFAFRVVMSRVLGVWGNMGVIGVWIAMIIDWVFRTAMFVRCWVRGDWLETAGLGRYADVD